ncbi:MAG: hypothetical protein FJ087_09910 [Deltaproteobacteria bacterium]|nr:hypothetical protein [Deltaproteobacteria bacterium]
MSDSDLAGCLRHLECASAHGEPVDADRLERAVRAEVRKRHAPERAARLPALLRALGRPARATRSAAPVASLAPLARPA